MEDAKVHGRCLGFIDGANATLAPGATAPGSRGSGRGNQRLRVKRRLVPVFSCALFCGPGVADLPAQTPGAATLPRQDLAAWVAQYPDSGSRLRRITLPARIVADQKLQPFSGETISGLGISGAAHFRSDRSTVRVVLVDSDQQEYLVYESYPLLAPTTTFNVENACRETCLLPPVVPSALKVELVDASIDIRALLVNEVTAEKGSAAESTASLAQQRARVKASQEAEIVEVLNRRIKTKGLRWRAGETSLSRMSYAEKKAILSCTQTGRGNGPNLLGAEYYKGGIFEVSPASDAVPAPKQASAMVESFDWRSRHGANRPGSPYYAGSASGWMSSVKNQLCADCWAHSALGATEAQVNLYFNEHIDMNLSEQELVSCSSAGGCSGGNTGAALSYVATMGIVDEACFPESGTDEQCLICPVPKQRVRIAGFEDINPMDGEDNIKRRLIKYGPLPFGISSWWHAMVLAGYQTDAVTGETVWILKNSWGPDWGEEGYGYVIVPLSDIYLTYNLLHPVISEVSWYNVTCRDSDGDGYRNWGLSDDPPPLACGPVPPINDCDDSDRTVALLTEDGRCIAPPRRQAGGSD